MAIKDKDQAGTGLRPIYADSTGLHSSPGNNTLTTGSYTLDTTYGDMFCDCSGGNITLTLPAAASANAGKRYRAFKTDSTTNTLTVNGVVMGSNTGVSVIEWESTGSAWKLVRLYEEGTYTATLTGCTTSPTVTVSYVREGKSVTIRHASIFATSNSTACTLTGMPSHIYPGATTDMSIASVYNAGNTYPGIIRISTAGVVTPSFYDALTAFNGTFTNSATNKGFALGISVSYITA